MPSLSNFMRSDDKDEAWLDTANRADTVQWMIDRDGVSITLIRQGVVQTAQNCLLVRVGTTSRGRETRSATGESAEYDVILIGVRGHDDPTVTDFDIQRKDVFTHNSTQYEVIDVSKIESGKTEANCKARL